MSEEKYYPDADTLRPHAQDIIKFIAERELTYSQAQQLLDITKEFLAEMTILKMK